MSFFPREKSSLRSKTSTRTFDYDNHYHSMLNGLNANFTLGGNSGFPKSPYEIFRENVANYCERFMYDSFDQKEFMTSEEKSLRALQRSVSPLYDERLAEGDGSLCDHQNLPEHRLDSPADSPDEDEEGPENTEPNDKTNCYCTNSMICEHCRARPCKSDTNLFSVMSVTFEPMEKDRKSSKPSMLKKITHLMNKNFNSHKGKMPVSQTQPLKLRCELNQWTACECHVHIGKHNNCCQCQEPYHRTNCECEQHNGSHSYCCRCDPHLLLEYDQHLKKKKYLRLLNEEEDLSAVNSVDCNDEAAPKGPRSFSRSDGACTEDCCSGQRLSFPRNRLSTPAKRRPMAGGRYNDDRGEPEGNHPCESCCKKLDDIYGKALREVHSMLMDVSRTLLPSARCYSLETRIQNVSRLRPSPYQMRPPSLETVESTEAEPDWSKNYPEASGTNEVAVQVTPKDLNRDNPRKKLSRFKNLKKQCVVS